MRPIPEIRADLARVDRAISDAYWLFSRSPSPRRGPPDGNLYIQRNALRDEMRAAKALETSQ